MRAIRLAALALTAVGLATCADAPSSVSDNGPRPPAGQFSARVSLASRLSEEAAFSMAALTAQNLGVNAVRVVLVRPPSEVLKDTVVTIAPGQTSVQLDLTVNINGVEETLAATIQLRNGPQVLFSGTQTIVARANVAGTPPPTNPPVELGYVGPGASTTRIELSPAQATVQGGATRQFSAAGFDAADAAVPDLIVGWSTNDGTIATIDPVTGLLTAGQTMGTVTVRATSPNQVVGEATVTVTLPPSKLEIVSGNTQTGTVGSALAQPLVVKVLAADNSAVPGVAVDFAVITGGGSVSAAQVATDAQGLAQVTATLGSAPGENSFSASVAGIEPAVGFTATAAPGAVASIAIVSGDGQTATPGTSVAIAPAVRVADSFGNPVPGAQLVFAVTSGGGSVTGGETVSDATGVATVGSWTLGSSGEQRLSATSGAHVVEFTANSEAPRLITEPEDLTTVTITAGEMPSAVIFRVLDHAGAPVTGLPLSLELPDGEGTGTTTIETNAEGRVTGDMIVAALGGVPEEAGTYPITASGSFNGAALAGSPRTVTLLVQPGPAASLEFSQQPPGTLGVGQQFSVVVAAFDQFGNLATAFGGNVTIAIGESTSDATLNGTLLVAAVGGQATFSDLAIDAAGSYTLRATAGALSIMSSTFEVISSQAQGILTFHPQLTSLEMRAGEIPQDTSYLRLTDAGGVGIGGHLLQVRVDDELTMAISTGDDGVIAISAIIGGDMSVWSQAGSKVITIMGHPDAPALEVEPVSFTLHVSAGEPTNLVKLTNPVFGAPNSIADPTPSVRLTDGWGNPIAGHTVSFVVDAGGGSVTGSPVVTDALGVATVGSWTFGESGQQVLFARISDERVWTSWVVQLEGPAAPTGLSVVVQPQASTTSGVPLTQSLKLRLVDEGGAPLSGIAVQACALPIGLLDGGETGLRAADRDRTRANALAAPVRGTPGTASFETIPFPPADPCGQGMLDALRSASAMKSVSDRSRMMQQNVEHDYPLIWSAVLSGTTLRTTDTAGEVTFDDLTVGGTAGRWVFLFFTDSDQVFGSTTSDEMTVRAGEPSQVIVVAHDWFFLLRAGESSTVYSWVADAWWNPVATGGTIALELSAEGPRFSTTDTHQAVLVPDERGIASVGLTAPTTLGSEIEPFTFNATSGNWSGGSAWPLYVIPGPPDPALSRIEVPGGSTPPDGVTPAPALIRLFDRYGNATFVWAGLDTVEVAVVSWSGAGAAPVPSILQRGDEWDVEFRSTEAGELRFTATINGAPFADTASVNFVATIGGNIIVEPAEAWLYVGRTQQMAATPPGALRAEGGEPLKRGTLAQSGGGNLEGATWSSSDPGVASVDGSGLVTVFAPGTVTITVTGDGIQGSATISALPVDYASSPPITAGGGHSCALDSGGAAYCWGSGDVGQLGTGTTERSTSPLQALSAGVKFASISAGGSTNLGHTCAVASSGAVFCWGQNGSGQLGRGSFVGSTLPVQVAGTLNFQSVTTGTGHSCGLTSERIAYCWGAGSLIGDGASSAKNSPSAVSGGLRFKQISAGGSHTCAVTPEGTAHCWGTNTSGQLGNGSNTASLVPVQVTGGLVFAAVSAGEGYTCGLAADGVVHCWGRNFAGVLGDGMTADRSTPGPVAGGNSYTAVTAGTWRACAIASDGTSHCWGVTRPVRYSAGTLLASNRTPTAVDVSGSARAVAVGEFHSCTLTGDGATYCWGSNEFGQLGQSPPGYSPDPSRVLGAVNFQLAVTGGAHSCGIDQESVAFCWGFNGSGNLGDGTSVDRGQPTQVGGNIRFASINPGAQTHSCGLDLEGVAYCWGSFPGRTTSALPSVVSAEHNFESLTSGPQHACGVTVDGGGFCWGGNANGQLGDGTTTTSGTPRLVSGNLQFRQISGGRNHSCALAQSDSDQADRVYCWGLNSSGQLGDGSTAARTTPAPVTTQLTFIRVSSGSSHSCALTSESAAYCWGGNAFGQLGDGTRTTRTTPTPVSGGLTFVSVTSGDSHSCGLRGDGTAFCWGTNIYGQLGNGTVLISLAPVQVTGGLVFDSISAGPNHTCGTTTSGAAYCWGYRGFGTLGDGSVAYNATPMAVPGAPAP
jgi:alpha-tubulin suppressor-like RCC1 family protein